MIFREADLNESKIISDFQVKMALETENLKLDKELVNQGVNAVFNDTSKGKYYVVEVNKKIIASLLTTYEWSDWRNSRILWIQSVYVIDQYRKRGVFKLMYSKIKELINQSNLYAGIRLYVDLTNETARKTYESVGMIGNHYQLFEDMK